MCWYQTSWTKSSIYYGFTLSLLAETFVICSETFANRLDPDQARQYVGPDLDPNFWHSDGIPEIIFHQVNNAPTCSRLYSS